MPLNQSFELIILYRTLFECGVAVGRYMIKHPHDTAARVFFPEREHDHGLALGSAPDGVFDAPVSPSAGFFSRSFIGFGSAGDAWS